jgi:hypothetical protein
MARPAPAILHAAQRATEVEMGHTTPGQFHKVTQRQAFGVAAITQRLADARFPCSHATVLRHFEGKYDLTWSEGETVDMRDLLKAVDQERFDDIHDLASACKQAAIELGYGEGGKKPTRAEP